MNEREPRFAKPSTETPAPTPSRPRPTLLIADDSVELRRLVRTAVGASYAEVIEVADGRGLFWRVVQACVDEPATPNLVVLADVRMPVYDGLEVLEALEELVCKVPLIVVTAYPDERVRARVERLGGCLLAKPFTLRQLRRVLEGAGG